MVRIELESKRTSINLVWMADQNMSAGLSSIKLLLYIQDCLCMSTRTLDTKV